jgi:threonine/homoserine/homoserine lactone efflux protein
VHLVPFLAVSAILVITPGVDMALVTKNALLHGRAIAQATALGINVGIFFWTIAAAAGLAAVGRNLLGRPRVRRAFDRSSGIALIGLGARLAFERRG